MIPEPSGGFAELCARACPGFRATELPRRARKSELLAGEVDGMPVIAKHVVRVTDVWSWYFDREVAMYRAFDRTPAPIRVPRFVGADHGVLVIERLAGSPLGARRLPEAMLSVATIRALVTMREQLASWDGEPPRAPPISRVRAQLRERLLEDPTAPVESIREGVALCARRGMIDPAVASRVDAALAAHAPVAFGHGDMLLRNVIGNGDTIALVDWECAGMHVHDWDLALLWSQLAPPMRTTVEHVVRAGGALRWAAFVGLTVYVLAREIRFLTGFGVKPRHIELVRLRGELAEATTRLP